MSTVSIHESLKLIAEYQKHHRLREMSGRSFAEEINGRVAYWSIGEFILILVCMAAQVLSVRGFFADKKDKVPART